MSALGAELLRTRRSAAARLLLAGPVACALAVIGQALVADRRSWTALMMWHLPYVTGSAAVLTALLVALVEHRERRARSGGTAWRAVPPTTQRTARVLVLAGLSLLTNLLVFLPFAPAGVLLGLTDPPLGRLLQAAVLVWAGGLGWLVVAVALARALGPWPVLALGVVWQLAGTVLAESGLWWALPPTWAVRPVLPLLGTHYNGVALEPGSPVWGYPAAPAVLAALLLAVVTLPAAVFGDARSRRLPRWLPRPGTRNAGPAPEKVSRTSRSRAAGGPGPGGTAGTAGLAGSLRRTAIVPLTLVVVALFVLLTAVYPPSYLDAFFGLAVLPGGAAVLAVLAWQAQEPAWRIVLTRAARPGAPPLRLLGVLGAVVAAVASTAAVLLVVDGRPLPDAAARVAVAVPLGWAVVTLTLWLHARLHVAVALAVAFAGTTGGVLFGGSVLAATPLWLAGPAGWAYSADTPSRMVVAATGSLLVAAVAGTGFVRTASRA